MTRCDTPSASAEVAGCTASSNPELDGAAGRIGRQGRSDDADAGEDDDVQQTALIAGASVGTRSGVSDPLRIP